MLVMFDNFSAPGLRQDLAAANRSVHDVPAMGSGSAGFSGAWSADVEDIKAVGWVEAPRHPEAWPGMTYWQQEAR
jgi:hypothetical protein